MPTAPRHIPPHLASRWELLGTPTGRFFDPSPLGMDFGLPKKSLSKKGRASATTADGVVFRADMRLRPFGASGPLAMSFDAMEAYCQTHGREWEPYEGPQQGPLAGGRRGQRVRRG